MKKQGWQTWIDSLESKSQQERWAPKHLAKSGAGIREERAHTGCALPLRSGGRNRLGRCNRRFPVPLSWFPAVYRATQLGWGQPGAWQGRPLSSSALSVLLFVDF